MGRATEARAHLGITTPPMVDRMGWLASSGRVTATNLPVLFTMKDSSEEFNIHHEVSR